MKTIGTLNEYAKAVKQFPFDSILFNVKKKELDNVSEYLKSNEIKTLGLYYIIQQTRKKFNKEFVD